MISAKYLHSLVMVLAISYTYATQVMQRPADYATKTKPNILYRRHPHEKHLLSIGQFVPRADMGRVNVGYFTNWGIYGRGFRPQDIDVSSLTHILYAFADVSPDSGTVVLSDTWSDQQKHYSGDSWNDNGNNLYGNFKQLYLLKQAHRGLNVLLSIGGWTYSQSGHFNFVTDDSKRAKFVSSALTILEDNGLDGFDLDFEYPTAGAQAQAFSKLLSELRTALDDLANKKGDKVPYQISAAVPAGATNYQALPIKEMDPSLSFWNLMAYDYAGSWSDVTDHQANLYGPSFNNVSTDIAVKWYTSNGACPGKINLGIPLYGRGFDNTYGVGKPFNGIGSGSWEAGIYDYKVLPFSGAKVTENSTIGASYSYDSTKKVLISYDTPNVATQKAQYIVDNQLGGAMFWDLSGDKTGTESLVGRTAGVFGTLDSTQNHLNYPGSKFDNMKNGMAAGQNSTTPGPADNSTAPANEALPSPSGSESSASSASSASSGLSLSSTSLVASSTGASNSTSTPASTPSCESTTQLETPTPTKSVQQSSSSTSSTTGSASQLVGDQNVPTTSPISSDILSTISSQFSSASSIPSSMISPSTTGPPASSTGASSSSDVSSITPSSWSEGPSSSSSSTITNASSASSALPSTTASTGMVPSTSSPNPSPSSDDSSPESSIPISSSSSPPSSSLSMWSDLSTSNPSSTSATSSSAASTSSTTMSGSSTGPPVAHRIKRKPSSRMHPRCFHSYAGRQVLAC